MFISFQIFWFLSFLWATFFSLLLTYFLSCLYLFFSFFVLSHLYYLWFSRSFLSFFLLMNAWLGSLIHDTACWVVGTTSLLMCISLSLLLPLITFYYINFMWSVKQWVFSCVFLLWLFLNWNFFFASLFDKIIKLLARESLS